VRKGKAKGPMYRDPDHALAAFRGWMGLTLETTEAYHSGERKRAALGRVAGFCQETIDMVSDRTRHDN
jgi:hypothetical protein